MRTTNTTTKPTLGVSRDANPVKKNPERANAKGMTDYNSIPFKNRDIDVLGRRSDIDMSQTPRSKKADRLAKKLANPNTSLDKWKKVMIKYNKETE